MYRGFNLTDIPFMEKYYDEGKKHYDLVKNETAGILEGFITPNGSIDGSSLQDNWFPQIECDIFISHSHKDEATAVALANFLRSQNISCFVDSCVWGNADKLLRTIDNRHCYNPSTNTYDYNVRNLTTSHVHMMLSNAITRLIDNTECIFFLNSPNSIRVSDTIEQTTSAWLYSEISVTQVIRKKNPERDFFKSESRTFSDRQKINESINIAYDVNLSHLTTLAFDDFLRWAKPQNKNQHALDRLYQLMPLTTGTWFVN